MLAHASGFTWDEALLVAAPLVVIAGLLAVAQRRVRRARRAEDAASDAADVRAE
jgi:hypothetical protein